MPLVQKTVQDFFGKEPNRSVNPDEVVAMQLFGPAWGEATLLGAAKALAAALPQLPEPTGITA